jgi:adenylate cyclase
MGDFSNPSPLRRLLQGALIGLIAFLPVAGLWSGFQRLEAKTWDMRVQWFAKPSPATDSIRLIFLDQASLDWGKNELGQSWPWMREMYAPLLDFCRRAGARSVAFDVVLSEPSSYGVADDTAFGDAARRNALLIQAFFPAGSSTSWPALFPSPFPPGVPDSSAFPTNRRSKSATFPIPEAATNAALLGHVRASSDPDGVIRRTSLFTFLDGRFVPSLGLAPALLDPKTAAPVLSGKVIKLGTTAVPLDRQGLSILRFRGKSQTHMTFSAKSVIQSELQLRDGAKPLVDPALFKDKYIFFGFTAHGLYDLRPTPMDRYYPGVEVHATALDNLLNGDFMTEVPAPVAMGATLLLCLLAGAAIRLCRTAALSALLLVLFLALPAALACGLYPPGYWMPFAAPETAVALSLVAALVTNYAAEGRQKKFIKGAFSQYLSPVVIEQLVQNPEKLTLGGEKKPLSILFSDIRGFTGISETLDPQALTALLNRYLTEMTTIIYEEGGTIDKYEGDAIIAFWNAPLDMADHAARAVRAAVRYQAKLREMRPLLKEEFGHELHARIGLNTGPVVIGNMGSTQRFNYTFLGDAGNLAARLEGINKQFGTPILVSQFTRDQAGEEFAFRKIARVAVVGRKEPVSVYEPVPRSTWAAEATVFESFERGLALFEKGDFAGALAVFEPAAADDPVSDAYRRKCLDLKLSPPARWEGVWVMTEK